MIRQPINGCSPMRCLAWVSLFFSAAIANAAPLAIGVTLYPAPAEPDPVGATLVASLYSLPFVSATFSGTLTSSVLTGDVSNPFGGLTFTYLLTNDVSSAVNLTRLEMPGWLGYLTDASYQAPTTGLQPTSADRLNPGNIVGFSFTAPLLGFGELLPGGASALMVIQTNATTFTTVAASAGPSFSPLREGDAATVLSFAPAPEPASLALLAAGLLCVSRRRLR